MEEIMINKITDVKYFESSIPTDKPFCATISATSPRVIIPTPIWRQLIPLNPHIFPMKPHPIILVTSATSTNAMENQNSPMSILLISVFRPILAKKIGANSI